MKILLTTTCFSLAVLITGCATIHHSGVQSSSDMGTDAPSVEEKEAPIPEIPDYVPLAGQVNVSAKVCVYRTCGFADILEEALRKAGYGIVPVVQSKGVLLADRPNFIVEPLTFNHSVENRRNAKWLYTRLTVQVRTPFEAAFGETGVGLASAPRIFQVYAMSKLPPDASVGETEYNENATKAVENLMCVPEFRDSLTRTTSVGVGKISPLMDFIVPKSNQTKVGADEGIPSRYLQLKPSFVVPPRRQAQPLRAKDALVGVWKAESNTESWSLVAGKMNCNKFVFTHMYTLRADGTISHEFINGRSKSVFEGTWSYEDGCLLMKFAGKDGKAYVYSLNVVWYSDSQIEIRRNKLDEYRASLMVEGVKRVSASYDENGCLKTYMEFANTTPVFMIESPYFYVKQ